MTHKHTSPAPHPPTCAKGLLALQGMLGLVMAAASVGEGEAGREKVGCTAALARFRRCWVTLVVNAEMRWATASMGRGGTETSSAKRRVRQACNVASCILGCCSGRELCCLSQQCEQVEEICWPAADTLC